MDPQLVQSLNSLHPAVAIAVVIGSVVVILAGMFLFYKWWQQLM